MSKCHPFIFIDDVFIFIDEDNIFVDEPPDVKIDILMFIN